MLLLEQCGRHLVMEPYLSSVVMSGQILEHCLAGERQHQMMAALTGGTQVFALAWAEDESRADPRWCETAATPTPDGFTLSGRKVSISHGARADTLLVTAQTNEGLALLLVDATTPGLEWRHAIGLDGRPTSELRLQEVKLLKSAAIATGDHALDAVERALDHGIAGLAAECLGSMGFLLTETARYLKTRQQFGRPLSDFQVLQHRLADAAIAVELTRSLTYLATASLDGNIAARKRTVSAAKVQLCRAARLVGQSAVQLHGATGLVTDLPISHHFTRLTMNTLLLGEEEWHLKRFAAIPAA